MFPKTGVIWPLQVDLVQQVGPLLLFDDRDLHLFFAATLLQKEHDVQHDNIQVKEFLSLNLSSHNDSPSRLQVQVQILYCTGHNTTMVICTASVSWQVAGRKKQLCPGGISDHAFYPVVSRREDRISCPDPVVAVCQTGYKGESVVDP